MQMLQYTYNTNYMLTPKHGKFVLRMTQVYVPNNSPSSTDIYYPGAETSSKLNTLTDDSKSLYILPRARSDSLINNSKPGSEINSCFQNQLSYPGNIKTAALQQVATKNSSSLTINHISEPPSIGTGSNDPLEEVENFKFHTGSQFVLRNGEKILLLGKGDNDKNIAQHVEGHVDEEVEESRTEAREEENKVNLEHSQENTIKKLEQNPIISSLLSPTIAFSPPDNVYSLASSDFFSPLPAISFSPIDKSQSLNKFKLQMVLEELLESEETYITAMTMLLNYYIEPFIIKNKNEIGQPLKLIKLYLKELIINHSNLLTEMRLIILSGKDIELLSIKIAKKVSEVGVDIHLYEEYCNIYEDVLKLVKDNELYETNKLVLNDKWVKGWENYLEATQPISKHMDLSFFSLIQRPISRIGKYRLILESLLKYIAEEHLELINTYLIKIRHNLTRINDKSREFKENELNHKINDLLNFENIIYDFKISSQFFGKSLLIGSLFGIWIENNLCKSSILGSFLFKSHLILCDLNNKKIKKFEIKFIIPISKCKLLKDSKEIDGGLYSNYPYLLKLIFEHKYCHYEILLISISKKEHEIWLDYLNVLINFVNGPYQLDFSNFNYDHLMVYPDMISPYDISLRKSSNYERYRSVCYFKESFTINILLNFYIKVPSDLDENKSFLFEYFNSINQSEDNDEISIFIKKNDRTNAQISLSSVWSKELPLLFYEGTKPSLKKSSSWSTIRMGSLKSLRHSNSFNGVVKTSEIYFDIESPISMKPTAPTNNSDSRPVTTTTNNEAYEEKVQSLPLHEELFDNKTVNTELTDNDINRSNSRSVKFKNAVLGLFQASRSNSYKVSNH